MASRGTWEPSPPTETFHRPTGRAERSLEEKLSSLRETVRKRGEKVKAGEREGMSSS